MSIVIEKISDLLTLNIKEGDKLDVIIGNRSSGVINDKTNIMFRIAYILWVLRGSNQLEDLMYYSNHMFHYSDNLTNLRGAYGPRLMFWVGADQLQDAINVNMNIDDDKDFVKPDGINQIKSIYEDFSEYKVNTSVAVIKDPAIDFEISNDIPDLISMTFYKKTGDGELLNLQMNYSRFDLNENHLNDIYLGRFLLRLLCDSLHFDMGVINVNSSYCVEYEQSLKIELYEIPPVYDNSEEEIVSDVSTIENGIEDIHKLFFLDRHIKNMITSNVATIEDVSIETITEAIERKIISNINSKYLKNCGYALLIGAIKKHVPTERMFEDYILQLLQKMSGPIKYDISKWLLYCGDNLHTVFSECTETIDQDG